MEPQSARPVEVFYSYSHKDEELLEQLIEHLASLRRQGVIVDWHDRKIGAGSDWKNAINEHVERAGIILLLVSASFINSDYCYGVEVRRALERHAAGKARVIPVLLRDVDWKGTPFEHLTPLPSGGVAVTSWDNRDEAFANIAAGLRRAVAETPASGGRCHLSSLTVRPPAPKFVERWDDKGRNYVERLTQELQPQENRMLTLWGRGGVGKTTLAFEVACRWKETYGGRVVWSDAERPPDYTLESLLEDVVTQLDRPEMLRLAREEKKARAAELLAAAPTLIVLDSYELIAPGSQPFIGDWLGPAKCVVLFISREEVDNSSNFTVHPMTPGESQELLGLWVEQTEDEKIFTEKICLRIAETAERVPYIMEWIFGQINAGDVPDKVFKDLQQGKGDVGQRVFDRSFNLPQLGEDGRVTLLALSLFKPSATRKALAVAAGFGGDDDRLQAAIGKLRRLKLIKGEEQNARQRIEGLTLSMAAARLPKSKYAAGIRERFVAYFRDFTLAPDTKASDLDIEKNNILRAMQLAPHMQDWDTVVELYSKTLDLIPHFYSFKAWVEAIKLSEGDGERRIRISSPPPIVIEIYHRDKKEVQKHYGEIRRKLEVDKRWMRVVRSAAEFELGVFAYEAGDFPLAEHYFEAAKKLKKDFNDEFGAALASNNLGVVMVRNKGKNWAAEAAAEFEKALDTFDPVGQSLKDKVGFKRWVAMAKARLLAAFSPKKKGKRFAKVVRRNMRWMKRVKKQREGE